MKRQQQNTSVVVVLAGILGVLVPLPALAGFALPGYDLQVVQSGQGLVNSAVSFQTNRTWIDSTPAKPYSFGTSFALPSCDEILFTRLYMDVWGGTNTYTSQIDTTVNGNALQVVNIGGTADSNPTYDPSQTCVYGSGYGTWQLAYAGTAGLLNLDGTANSVSVTISDSSGQFDGRTVDITLVTVYRDQGLDQVLDYYLAEADGYMRRTPGTPGSPAERELSINSINISDVTSASYTAHYTHGTADQFDRIYFNGTQLDGDDVAWGQMGAYGPDVPTFDVANLLLTNSTVRYSVDETVVGTPSEFSLRAKIGLLEITHPIPEPGTLAVLTLGSLVLMRRRHKCQRKS